MPPPAVVDTNVIVAGLLTGDAGSPVAAIVDGMLRAAFPFVVSVALLAEYRDVLLRPQLRKLHGLSIDEVETLLTAIARNAIVLAPAEGTPAPDPGDQLLWDLLAARQDLMLVTGDLALVRHAPTSPRVVTPREFVDLHPAPTQLGKARQGPR